MGTMLMMDTRTVEWAEEFWRRLANESFLVKQPEENTMAKKGKGKGKGGGKPC